ncbi:hypothetical protein BD769DRAFT_1675384 [Suillus cothurnatus]|nr:hypothetical protein BD769DRAFT_1675384 [Suillus cothurnatus]
MPSSHLTISNQPPLPAPLTAVDDTCLLDTILDPAPHVPFAIQSTTMIQLVNYGNSNWLGLNLLSSDLGELGPSEEPGEVVTDQPAPTNALHLDLKWRDSQYLWGQFNFLTALQIDGKTYTDLMEQPLILRNGKEKTSVGWQIICTHMHHISSLPSLPPNTFEQLLSLFDNTKSELRKVIKGVMSPITDFCAKEEIKTTIKRFLSILNSGHNQAISDKLDTRTSLTQPCIVQVQEALAKLVVHQLFREVLWVALFVPINGLADRKSSGRIADLFPKEPHASVGCLAQDTIGNLLTLIYHTMLLVLREGLNKESITSYKRHEVMNEVIISTLTPIPPCSHWLSACPTKGFTHDFKTHSTTKLKNSVPNGSPKVCKCQYADLFSLLKNLQDTTCNGPIEQSLGFMYPDLPHKYAFDGSPIISIGPHTDAVLDRFKMSDEVILKLCALTSTVHISHWQAVLRSKEWAFTFEQAANLVKALNADLQLQKLDMNPKVQGPFIKYTLHGSLTK